MIQKTRKKQAVIANPRLALARDRSRISLYIPEVLSASTSQKSYQPLHPRSHGSNSTQVLVWNSHAKIFYFLCQSVRLSPKLRLGPMQLKSISSSTTWTLNRTCQTLRRVLTWLQKTLFSHGKAFGLMPIAQVPY